MSYNNHTQSVTEHGEHGVFQELFLFSFLKLELNIYTVWFSNFKVMYFQSRHLTCHKNEEIYIANMSSVINSICDNFVISIKGFIKKFLKNKTVCIMIHACNASN